MRHCIWDDVVINHSIQAYFLFGLRRSHCFYFCGCVCMPMTSLFMNQSHCLLILFWIWGDLLPQTRVDTLKPWFSHEFSCKTMRLAIWIKATFEDFEKLRTKHLCFWSFPTLMWQALSFGNRGKCVVLAFLSNLPVLKFREGVKGMIPPRQVSVILRGHLATVRDPQKLSRLIGTMLPFLIRYVKILKPDIQLQACWMEAHPSSFDVCLITRTFSDSEIIKSWFDVYMFNCRCWSTKRYSLIKNLNGVISLHEKIW